MNKIGLLLFSLAVCWLPTPANALPGQTTDVVTTWIQAHPTLRPGSGERLMVRKSNSPAQRFLFQASVLPPGRATPAPDSSIISHERIELFDSINGVTRDRLEESLRSIYGSDIYQDYTQARVVYEYPSPLAINQARTQSTPLRESLQGQLRQGVRFAYWVETAEPRNGIAVTGRMVVFLRSDLDKMETELRNR
ncbi:hypothetical protein H6G20_18960 [Desertifilum sp. FACHB-1129]|uniref:Chalcone isomerase domain-containing protein n=1 Tax=Desertifilum tharense IPPAS B-1220 TaxID=1781255 RepID=A0A1E5QG58_9CYAN|nr:MULTISPECIES: hypothetical protein [Desertifilum]MDA0209980.1 hypothetical protein [Cyanobacteria bacterium FC1]MBD2313753.1 hypothetical protein [Desertifilum sp. FACHB-1129]MBD2324537.1 hypothetical protein [Desertifilum sp. FACHB-866]MBD2334551.1 hypothetical protein [Desertifilum sp. FACHB-868]OEJ73672.1 hypothetical protein BH720_18655 [Desertifilum tharense IPPAS B-1220]